MKRLPYIIIVWLSVACVAVWFRPCKQPPAEIRTETKIRTVVKTDTLLISAPMAVFFRFTRDTIRVGDTIVRCEQAYYEDSLYRAWVSGYRPRLDSLEVFPKTVYQTVTNDIYHTIKPKKSGGGLACKPGMECREVGMWVLG